MRLISGTIFNGVWEANWTTNASLLPGALANYTIYANDTANNTVEWDSNFSVNYRPTQGQPVIYSGHFNTTFGNLTCYNISTTDADGDAVVNVFDFRLNGASDAVLNMPFEANRNYTQAKDYSSYGNNGTVYGARLTSAGKSGSAYYFDGINDYIDLGNPSALNTNFTAFALEAWVMINTTPTGEPVIVGKGAGIKYALTYYSDGKIYFYIYTGSNYISSGTGFSLNEWHHIVGTFNGTGKALYIDGTQVAINATDSYGATGTYSGPALIGGGYGGYYLNGSIDEVHIYNRSLSAEEVRAHYNAGTPQYNLQEKSALSYGQSWTCAVTPNDGSTDGNVSLSIGTTIKTPPTQGTPTINTTYGTNRSNENITAFNVSTFDVDFDSVTNAWNWYRNRTSIAVLNMPFDTNYSSHSAANIIRDYSDSKTHGTGGGGTSSKAPAWTLSGISGGAYKFDGIDDFISISALQASPNMTGSLEAWVKVDKWGTNYDSVIFKGPGIGWADIDYGLLRNAGNNQFLGTLNDGTNSMSSNGPKSSGSLSLDTWYHLVFTWDGINATFYTNGTQTGKTAWAYGAGTRSGALNIGLAVNNASYPFNGSIDEARIYNITLTAAQVAAIYNANAPRYDRIEQSMTWRGETWSACVTPIDGWYDGNTLCTQNITILNTAPTHSTPTINTSSGTNYTNENITAFNVSTADADNDNVKNIWNWNKNGKSILLLNMPFDTNISSNGTNLVRDYSGYGRNGTLGNTSAGSDSRMPLWRTGSSCISGGCYEFDGTTDVATADKISIASTSLSLTSNYTIEAWVKSNLISQPQDIISQNGPYFLKITSSKATVWIVNNTAWTILSGNSTLTSNTWYHFAATYDGEWIRIYVNGTLDGRTEKAGPRTTGNDPIADIGYPDSGGEQYPFNGTIDEVRIWNATLAADQILALYQNQTNRIHSSMTLPGENWSACVTPNDGYEDGSTLCTINLTIRLNTVTTTLSMPLDGWITNSTAAFECSATGNITLSSISLWHNNTGTWHSNKTNTVSGTSASTAFNLTTLTANSFVWNCYACDVAGVCAYAAANRTLIIDNTKPDISFVDPTPADATKKATLYNNA
ncbi:MAG: LamG domain-containing protein, partial [Nanoarchaeota archaeon]|nr:LamG domain-containing protein [Nanoarchaeota archaeon]